MGETSLIGADFYDRLARSEGLELHRNRRGAGLLSDVSQLSGPSFDPALVDARVAHFYERTVEYEIDAWSEWTKAFRLFGRMLAVVFSRRLQQLNVPLSALDTSLGMTSDILQLVEPHSGEARYTAWVRRLVRTQNVLYAGTYSVARVPGYSGACVRVIFPLPNGNAVVVMRPEVHADGSVTITSAGEGFGDPGFYFTVHDGHGRLWARYVASMRESIHVYGAEDGMVRADHVLTLFGMTFLRLHYRLRPRQRVAFADAT